MDVNWGWGVINYTTYGFDSVLQVQRPLTSGGMVLKNIERTFKGAPCLQFNVAGACTAVTPQLLGNATGWHVQSGYY